MTNIRDIEGNWEVVYEGPNTSATTKSDYYPEPGVEIELKIEVIKTLGEIEQNVSALKGRVIGNSNWSGKDGFEKATFFFNDGRLVSTPIETDLVDPDSGEPLSFVEYSVLSENGSRMKHFLYWSDGDVGGWGCRPKSA